MCFIGQCNHVLEFNYGESLATNSIKKVKMPIYFKILTVRLHVVYVLNMHVESNGGLVKIHIQSKNVEWSCNKLQLSL